MPPLSEPLITCVNFLSKLNFCFPRGRTTSGSESSESAEESDEDIDMSEMDNALADVENAMQEDSESSVSTDASQEE